MVAPVDTAKEAGDLLTSLQSSGVADGDATREEALLAAAGTSPAKKRRRMTGTVAGGICGRRPRMREGLGAVTHEKPRAGKDQGAPCTQAHQKEVIKLFIKTNEELRLQTLSPKDWITVLESIMPESLEPSSVFDPTLPRCSDMSGCSNTLAAFASQLLFESVLAPIVGHVEYGNRYRTGRLLLHLAEKWLSVSSECPKVYADLATEGGEAFRGITHIMFPDGAGYSAFHSCRDFDSWYDRHMNGRNSSSLASKVYHALLKNPFLEPLLQARARAKQACAHAPEQMQSVKT